MSVGAQRTLDTLAPLSYLCFLVSRSSPSSNVALSATNIPLKFLMPENSKKIFSQLTAKH